MNVTNIKVFPKTVLTSGSLKDNHVYKSNVKK